MSEMFALLHIPRLSFTSTLSSVRVPHSVGIDILFYL